jgi:hypothetical protein
LDVGWQGRVFIDRDPQHFGLILNFLRDGVCVLPVDEEARKQILQEADFYQVCYKAHVDDDDAQGQKVACCL